MTPAIPKAASRKFMPISLCTSKITGFRSQILRSLQERTTDQAIPEIHAEKAERVHLKPSWSMSAFGP
jgi:hypothetical protein